MKKIFPLIKGSDIFLLEKFWKKEEASSCQLKDFINFVKSMDFRRPIDFSYVPREGNLIPNLTLKDNLFLEAIPMSLSTSKEFRFKEYLDKGENEHFFQLYQMITKLDHLPEHVDMAEQKILCILKALLKKSEFLFLEDPELHLCPNEDLINKVKAALAYESRKGRRFIILATTERERWNDIITHTISLAKNGQYQLQKGGSASMEREGELPSLKFKNLIS